MNTFMISATNFEQSEAREEAEQCLALWLTVLRHAVVADRDLEFLESSDFRYICHFCALDPDWVKRKLNEAGAVEEPPTHHRLRAKRSHSEVTRKKIRTAIARHHANDADYDEWRAAIRAGQVKRWARAREKVPSAA